MRYIDCFCYEHFVDIIGQSFCILGVFWNCIHFNSHFCFNYKSRVDVRRRWPNGEIPTNPFPRSSSLPGSPLQSWFFQQVTYDLFLTINGAINKKFYCASLFLKSLIIYQFGYLNMKFGIYLFKKKTVCRIMFASMVSKIIQFNLQSAIKLFVDSTVF